jgi:hypothetical protein
MSLYFNSKKLPKPTGEYIAWCDGMGTGRELFHSIHHAANFVFKIHKAFSNALELLTSPDKVRIYPVIDGMYLTTPDRKDLQKVLSSAFAELSNEFVGCEEHSFRFIVRGGIAYGATLHGSDVPPKAFIPAQVSRENPNAESEFEASALNNTRSGLLLSPAMVLAYNAESQAPPFGYFVDDSAMSVPQLVDSTDTGFFNKTWKWWPNDDEKIEQARKLWVTLQEHYKVVEGSLHGSGYPVESFQRHTSWAKEYPESVSHVTPRPSSGPFMGSTADCAGDL